ncbi:carbonic anhydrase 1-like [Dermacentor variabilis]|uniref:carbonic anhydrase 1-like n=1 Tax=Dermacentor variabilis TaxID=34621 RepID=UPI003F5C8DB8
MATQISRGSSTTTTTLQGYPRSSTREAFKLNPCTGKRQSPIGLCTPGRGQRLERARADLNMHGYDIPFSQYEVKDSNAVLRVQPLGAIQPSVSGSGLPGRFLLHDLHFHVGLDDTYGSEHTVDGKPFAMEAHFVHYNDQFRSFEEAVTEKDGLAVISVLFKLSDHKSPESLQAIMSAMESPGSSKVAPLVLSQMLPGIPPTSYYLYSGSLTTPPWSENVTWVVCTQTLEVTSAALARFRKNASGKCKGNIRPTQPLGEREVILCA